MSFTNQQPFTLDAQQVALFTRRGKRFNCALCGVEFKPGDTVRWVYANDRGFHCGNFFVCSNDNTPDVLERAKASFAEAVKLAKQWGIYGPDWQKGI